MPPALVQSDIVCFEVGSGANNSWHGLRQDLIADLDVLEQLHHERTISLRINGPEIVISGTDRVGLIILPSGRRLILKTKISNVSLLEWLIYLNEIPVLRCWLDEEGIELSGDFYTSIGSIFLSELEIVTRLHMRKDYDTQHTEERNVRGRIRFKDLAVRTHRLPRLPVQYRLRTYDTPYNLVLALALDKLRTFAGDFKEEQRRMQWALMDQWAGIKRVNCDVYTTVSNALWACPPGYRNAVKLASLILLGFTLTPHSGSGGQAFTVSLDLIWERSLRRMFSDLSRQTNWAPLGSDERIKHWDDSGELNSSLRWLSVDVLLEREKKRWILDAKYKRDFGTESRADRFQICSYALAFDADRASLVYPSADGNELHIRQLLKASVGAKQITIDSLELPMAAGPTVCLDALLSEC